MSAPHAIVSVKRLIALAVIFFVTAGAWFVLAGVVAKRTAGLDERLRNKVAAMWGNEQEQQEPTFTATAKKVVTVPARGRTPARTYTEDEVVTPTTRSDVAIVLTYEPRQKGLLWYNLYTVDFGGTYSVENPLAKEMDVQLRYTFPDAESVYDTFVVLLDGEALSLTANGMQRTGTFTLKPRATRTVAIQYRSQGLDAWQYQFARASGKQEQYRGQGVHTISNFTLTATTNVADVDFVEQSLAPQKKTRTDDGWRFTWSYDQLVSGQDIGILLPQKLNPGPFVQRVTIFAPVALAFYFFVLLMVIVLRRIPLHPMHFAFLAAAFFAFHLLFAYLADHLAIRLSFAIAAMVSVALSVSYLRLVAGLRFALVEAGLAQLVYLLGFTYSFFFEGYTGLIITILAIVTLAIMMQLTGRVPWAQLFARPPTSSPS